MKTLLQAMQLHRSLFLETVKMRLNTSTSNKSLHLKMSYYLLNKDWEGVEAMLLDSYYQKPLEGVVYCLNKYNDLNNEDFHEIVTLEVYQYNEITPYSTHITDNLKTCVEDFSAWIDFPEIETFYRMFISNNQSRFEKLYLDDKGNITIRFVFTKEN